jgi:hypothetical protein
LIRAVLANDDDDGVDFDILFTFVKAIHLFHPCHRENLADS